MKFFTTIYVLLLAYIIAAILFWGWSLQRQSKQIYAQERAALAEHVDSTAQPSLYRFELANLESKKDKRKKQYLGEGGTFLVFILIGASVVYSSYRRSISLSRQQNNFMLSVTHELKSPIAAMKLNLQTLEKHQLDPQKTRLLTGRCILEANRLNDLCNNMLIASQIEARQYKNVREPFDFGMLVSKSVEEYVHRYGTRFEAATLDEGIVNGDQVMLEMAVNNLLENVVKYTPAETPCVVSFRVKGRRGMLTVADSGPGIPGREKRNVFKKFYRVGNESTRKTKGTGLGLYLTKRIISRHGGNITVKDNHPQGSVFEINIPLEKMG